MSPISEGHIFSLYLLSLFQGNWLADTTVDVDVVFNFFFSKKELSLAGTWNHVEMEQLLAACTWQPSTVTPEVVWDVFRSLHLGGSDSCPCPLQHPLSPPHPPSPSQSLYKLSGSLFRTSVSVRTYPWWNTNYILARLHGMLGFPGGTEVKNLPANAEDSGDTGSTPGEDPLQKGQPTPVCLPGESHGQRSLVGHSPCCRAHSWTLNTGTHAHVGYWPGITVRATRRGFGF